MSRKFIYLILGVVAFLLRWNISHRDAYLHDWDEKFHALVAKNCMSNPLKPMLIAQQFREFNLTDWSSSTIWLHKQPMFIWQMSLSMKLFGISEYSIRYPSVIFGTIMVLLIYRISFLLTNCDWVSILASLFWTISAYQLELTSGYQGLAHNDISFGFYILLSFWAYIEYLKSNNTKWNILTGLFAGFAVMNKWLVGLLVFFSWTVNTVLFPNSKQKSNPIVLFLFSLFLAILIFLPWQFYILSNYQEVAMYEYRYNTRHISEVIEGHSGGIFYYLKLLPYYFGSFLFWGFPLGVFCAYRNPSKYPNNIVTALVSSILVVYLFFSLIVQTKMWSYCYIVAPFILVFIALGVVDIYNHLIKRWQKLAVVAYVIIGMYSLSTSIQSIKENSVTRAAKIYNNNIFRNLNHMIPKNTALVLNTSSFDNIEIMFYNNLTAYDWWLDSLELEKMKQHRIQIAVFKNYGSNNLPSYYRSYPYLSYIDTSLISR